MDFLKQEKLLDLLERALPYDIIVIDEAHHYAESGSSDPDETERSQRRKLGEVLARRSDSLLLLSATPHDGYERSFASLLELLDPCLVDGRGLIRGQQYREHLVRRLKQHVRLTNPETGLQEPFKERKVIPIEVHTDDELYQPFVQMHQQLLTSIVPELKRAMAARNYDDALAYLALLKRSTSTVEALYLTLDRVQSRLQHLAQEQQERAEAKGQRLKTLRSLEKKLARFGSLSPEEEAERQELEIEDLARKIRDVTLEAKVGKLAAQQSRFAADTLLELKGVVEAARSCDPKLDEVIRQIRAIRANEPEANILIYTEYKDSQQRLVEVLLAAGFAQPLTLSGEDSEGERLTINDTFRTQSNQLLVATDAAAEGLNLQQRCHHLIHLELPWNPNRTEQRNGRIDRYGQTLDPHIRLLFLCGTFEERILARLIAKYELQRKHLHFVPNTLGLGMDDLPTEGLFALLTDEQATTNMGRPCRRFTFEHPEEVEGDQEVAALLAEIDKSLRSFEKVARDHSWLSREGAFAEDHQPQSAAHAYEIGKKAGGVDLLQFVCDAVRLEGGQVRELLGAVTELRLPPSWRYELEGFPGWHPETGTFRFTDNLAVEKDRDGKPVGFLGRSHPLVKRAVDHVRHLELGQADGPDRRVSAAYSPWVSQPTLIVTFLARLQSDVGREWERIFALRMDASGTSVPLLETAAWLPDLSQGAPTRDLWNQQFRTWGETALISAKETARSIAGSLSQTFAESHQLMLAAERRLLNEWLMSRTEELMGKGKATVRPVVQQSSLFDPASEPQESMVALVTPSERYESTLERTALYQKPGQEVMGRLASFAADKSRTSRERGEAEVILSAYQRRMRELEQRASLRPVEVNPVGLLMLVPEGQREEREA